MTSRCSFQFRSHQFPRSVSSRVVSAAKLNAEISTCRIVRGAQACSAPCRISTLLGDYNIDDGIRLPVRALSATASPWTRPTAGFEVHSMPNIPHNYSITFRAVSLLGSQCCVLRYAAAPLIGLEGNSDLLRPADGRRTCGLHTLGSIRSLKRTAWRRLPRTSYNQHTHTKFQRMCKSDQRHRHTGTHRPSSPTISAMRPSRAGTGSYPVELTPPSVAACAP